MKTLKQILKEIKEYNEKYGLMSEEDSNEALLIILDGVPDDEYTISVIYGNDGIDAIRNAEQGIY